MTTPDPQYGEPPTGAKDRIIDRTASAGATVADKATDGSGRIKPVIPLAALGIAAAIVGIVIWRRRS
jgi:hypothetical protein